MTQETWIAEIVVEGLHAQFDVELRFNPGLNIIYGKNGRGKTTILHLLANALELDFERFSFLQFRRISIKNSRDDIVEIIKSENDDSPTVFVNGQKTSYGGKNSHLSEKEVSNLREILGGRPTYLPAFRSILERARVDANPYRGSSDRRDEGFDEMVEREFAALRDFAQARSLTPVSYRQLREEAAATAEKTFLCRQWFGRFVPVIRYPSVADVEDALSEEWRRAQYDISDKEQRMFEQTFVKIFRAISGLETTQKVENNDNLLTSIAALLEDQESQVASSESMEIYKTLRHAAQSIGQKDSPIQGIDNSLLEIYRQALETRNTERKTAFQRSREFESSINKFLDRKAIKIGQLPATAVPRSRAMVAVQTESGHTYGLSALSSGERQILTMVYSASRTKFLSGVFLIDEPELSLHIDWQRIVLRELRNQSIDRQIIACTHSPEVGADHMAETQDFDPKRTVKHQESLFSEEDI